MLNSLRNINGQDFLVYYGIFSISLILLTKLLVSIIEKTFDNENIDINNMTPLEILTFKTNGNFNEILNYYLFKMWRKKMIDINSCKSDTTIISIVENSNDIVEREILNISNRGAS